MDPKPMYVERNEQNDVIMYYILCPKCKQYNSLNPRFGHEKAALDGTERFWCKSTVCCEAFYSRTLLEIVRGRAVVVNQMPKPDIQKAEPDEKKPRLWAGVTEGDFRLPRNSQN